MIRVFVGFLCFVCLIPSVLPWDQDANNAYPFSGIEPVFDKGEAFSGAFFGRTEQLLESPKVKKYLTLLVKDNEEKRFRLMCEAATFMMFQRLGKTREPEMERWGGPPGQAVDLFDLSVLHLSSTERLFNKHMRNRVPEQVNAILDKLDAFYCASKQCERNIRNFAGEVNEIVGSRSSSSSSSSKNHVNKQRPVVPMQSERRRLAVTMEKTHDLNMLFNTSSLDTVDKKQQSLTKQAVELKELKHEMRRLRNVMDRYRLHDALLPDTYDLSLIYDGVLRALRSLNNLRNDVHYESTDSGVKASNDNSKDLKLKFIIRSADDRRNRGVRRRAGSKSTGDSQTALTSWLKTILMEEIQLTTKLLADGKDDMGVLETSLIRTARCVRAMLSTGRTGDGDLFLDGIETKEQLPSLQTLLDATVVVIPWLRSKGQGNSLERFREMYLRLTVLSLRPFFQKIYVAVKTIEDQTFLLSKTVTSPAQGLPLTDVWYIPDLKTDCRLPPAASREVRRRLKSGEWSTTTHKYLYFTEADQIFVGRHLRYLYNWMDKNPRAILTPHRLVVAAPAYLTQKQIDKKPVVDLKSDISRHSCCMDTLGMGRTRVHWKNVSDEGIQLFQIHDGVNVFPANVNLWGMLLRSCNVTKRERRLTCGFHPVHEDYYDRSSTRTNQFRF